MFTRKDYLDRNCTYREYYSQFVTLEVKRRVAKYIGLDRLSASVDEHLNDIPLSKWDSLGPFSSTVDRLREAGDYLTPAGSVCIAKEAARQLIESEPR